MIVFTLTRVGSPEALCLYNTSDFDIGSGTKISIKDFIDNNTNMHGTYVILPPKEKLITGAMVICQTGMSKKLAELYPEINVIELGSANMPENQLEESEINKLLRLVFQQKPNAIYISSTTPAKKSTLENGLKNILKGAGYKAKTSSSFFQV